MLTEIEHRYGPQVHILNNVYLQSLLAKLCSPSTFQPEINHLVQVLYENILIHAMNSAFPQEELQEPTRMTAMHPAAFLGGNRIKKNQKIISVNIARAGTFPSHVCYHRLHDVIAPECIRQDHIFAGRSTSADHKVTGTEIGATKIGGDKDKSIVLFPDPMGATGNTIITAIDHYKAKVPGRELKFISLHLIVTPEYLKKVVTAHPDIAIYALRLDRGLSSEAVLRTPPGTHWDQERGLNDKDYIVPGGGGFGEIMNNSFV